MPLYCAVDDTLHAVHVPRQQRFGEEKPVLNVGETTESRKTATSSGPGEFFVAGICAMEAAQNKIVKRPTRYCFRFCSLMRRISLIFVLSGK